MEPFSHVNSNTANVLEQEKVFTKQKGLTPSGLVWTPTSVAAAVSLFWDTNSNTDGDDYENVTKKKKSPRFKLKREIRYFHVVVVQWRRRNVQKKRDARAELLFVS